MRLLKMYLCVILTALSLNSSAQRLLPEVSSLRGVTSVYVGEAMIKAAGNSKIQNGNRTSIDFSKIINDLTAIEVIKCVNRMSARRVKNLCDSVLSQYPFEVISSVTSDQRNVNVSGVKKTKNFLSMLLISFIEGPNTVYILLQGNINIENLNQFLTMEL